MRIFAAVLAATLAISALHGAQADGPIPAASDHQPPRFLPAVALYVNDRFVGLKVGKTMHYSCKDALEDTQGSIQRAMETPSGGRMVGLCIPIPTYSAADLVPNDKSPVVDDGTPEKPQT